MKRKERGYGHETLIDVIRALYVEVAALGLKRIGAGVVEIWVEVFPPQYYLRNFGCWGLLSGSECPNGHETHTDVIRCLSIDVHNLCLKRFGPGVVEIWGEVSPDSV